MVTKKNLDPEERISQLEKQVKLLSDNLKEISRKEYLSRIDGLFKRINDTEVEIRRLVSQQHAVSVVALSTAHTARDKPVDEKYRRMAAALWAIDYFDADWWVSALRDNDSLSCEEWARILVEAHQDFLVGGWKDGDSRSSYRKLAAAVILKAIQDYKNVPKDRYERIDKRSAEEFLFEKEGGLDVFAGLAEIDAGQVRSKVIGQGAASDGASKIMGNWNAA